MGRKSILETHQVITDGNMSGNLTSLVTKVKGLDIATYVVNWVGTTPIGALVVEANIDGSEWVELDFGAPILVSGDTGQKLIHVTMMAFLELRLKFNFTSGIGTLQTKIRGNVQGA